MRGESTPEPDVPRSSTVRDYELAAQLAKLPGYALVGTRELAAMTGYALTSIRQRKVALPPAVCCSRRKMLWRLQDVREWLAKLSLARRSGTTRRALRHGADSLLVSSATGQRNS